MFDSNQTRAFKKAYENYRTILRFLENNKDMIEIYKDSFQEVVKAADLEIQRMLLDVSQLEKCDLNDSGKEFIKEIIESPEYLKKTIPGYFKFYRNMTSVSYQSFYDALVEQTNDILIGVRTAIKLYECTDNNYVGEIISRYRKIIYAFLDMSKLDQEENQKKAKRWIDIQRKAAIDKGITIETEEETIISDHRDTGIDSIIQDLKDLFSQQGLS